MNNIELGKRIASYRKRCGYTQQQLAEKLSVTNKTVSKWETGTTIPDIITIKSICNVLKIDFEQLISDELFEKQSSPQTKNKAPKRIKITIILFSIILLLLLVLLFLRKEQTRIYSFKSADEVISANGYLMIKNRKYTLSVNELELYDYDIGNKDISNIEYTVMLGDYILFRFGYLPVMDAFSGQVNFNDYLKTININVTEELFFDLKDIEDKYLIIKIRYIESDSEIKEIMDKYTLIS